MKARTHIITIFSAIAMLSAMLATAPVASALPEVETRTAANITKYANGTVCRFYDGYRDSQAPMPIGLGEAVPAPPRGWLCVAPASAYPDYRKQVVVTPDARLITGNTKPCHGYSLFPSDIDGTANVACTMEYRDTSIASWSYIAGTGWRSQYRVSDGAHLQVYPFATGWRWVYTQVKGWVAVPAADVAIKWFVPTT